jgi:Flp pilus assembly pilin Flp
MLKLFTFAQAFAVEKFYGFREAEDGQTMAEYGVVLAVITIATVAVFTLLSGGIRGAINRVIGVLGSAGGS